MNRLEAGYTVPWLIPRLDLGPLRGVFTLGDCCGNSTMEMVVVVQCVCASCGSNLISRAIYALVRFHAGSLLFRTVNVLVWGAMGNSILMPRDFLKFGCIDAPMYWFVAMIMGIIDLKLADNLLCVAMNSIPDLIQLARIYETWSGQTSSSTRGSIQLPVWATICSVSWRYWLWSGIMTRGCIVVWYIRVEDVEVLREEGVGAKI